MPAEQQAMVSGRARRPKRPKGFSLIELGIVIAVIAVLAGVVITGAGFFRAARQKTAVDLVLSIRAAATEFAMRHQNGLRYGNPTDPVGSVNIDALRAERLLPAKVKTPWQDANDPAELITVGPIALPANACAGFTCIEITLIVPAEECTDPILVASLRGKTVIEPTCIGNTLTVVMR